MTSRWMRLYYFAIFGAIGGLFAWQFSDLIGLSFTKSLILSEIVAGALIGVCIGLVLGIAEGALTRNVIQALRTGLFGAVLGAAGGAIGLPLAEILFQTSGAQVWSRALGWGLFGVFTGLAVGVKSGFQAWKSMVGGLIGGIMGGSLLEISMRIFSNATFGKAFGLILLGACVGIFIAFMAYALSRVWLEVRSGSLRGTDFILDKFIKKGIASPIIGSSPLKSDIVLPDKNIAPQHAMLEGEGDHFLLKDMSMVGTFVNSKKIEQVRLRNRDIIQLGKTELVYHEKR